MMNTRTKLRIAHALYRTVMGFRRLLGRTDSALVTRRGIRWQLDLREGIDLAIYLFGSFEYDTFRAYRKLLKPGNTVLDIGANIGAHTLPMARCVYPAGRVVAFEPTAYAYGKLRQNISLNPTIAGMIQAEQIMLVGIDNSQVKPRLYSSWQIHEALPDTHPKHGGRLMDTTGARFEALDNYIAEHKIGAVSLIKMDVDGHECQVLRGSHELLQRDKPILLIEIMPYGLDEAGASLDELLGILATHGYSLYDLDGRTALPNDSRIRQKIPTAGGINILCYAR
ncbi:MAG: FkbM family methyltransferase [Sulfuricaulis sp.]|uniref:FkbM family methyltransferase n=1 Tax=Sulfuricaulis sp. TaxID=2003553 RepID=UPI0034A103A6